MRSLKGLGGRAAPLPAALAGGPAGTGRSLCCRGANICGIDAAPPALSKGEGSSCELSICAPAHAGGVHVPFMWGFQQTLETGTGTTRHAESSNTMKWEMGASSYTMTEWMGASSHAMNREMVGVY